MKGKNDGIIFLIGAARSGTKIVRDVLSTHPDINRIPYDINFIWRTGNAHLPHDQLSPENYSIGSHKRIDRYLRKYRRSAPYIIEKTVSNTIRIPFLLKHYPNAKFIFLYRNGMDVCESVMRQWQMPNDKKYLLNKLKHVPLRNILGYGLKFARRNLNKTKGKFFWGVNYPGLEDELSGYALEELVAHQWRYCIERMLQDRAEIRQERMLEIRYEDFVLNPDDVIGEILQFIDSGLEREHVSYGKIRKDNIGKADKLLGMPQKQIILPIIEETMSRLNYKI